ncbi:MAG: hypothetical protein JWM74_4222 [Myxococcaceae bacterium]|nr:hypothetical protein [Myxococcaceae bacterium]
MLRNGLYLVAQMSVRASGDEAAAHWEKALVLGSLREDILFVPLLHRLTEYPSFSHFYRPGLPGGYLPLLWPGPRSAVDRLYARALREHRAGRQASAYVSLGRILHIVTDVCIPSHANRVAHDSDPFEWYVEGNLDTLRALPIPALPQPAASARRPSALVESLARTASRFRPDGTNHPLGRLLRRAGLRRKVTAREAADQAKTLIPLAAAHGAGVLTMFARDLLSGVVRSAT